MVKKLKIRNQKRKVKGGRTTLEKITGIGVEGPLVADNIYENVVNKHNATELKKEYKLRKDLADEAYKLAEDEYKTEEERLQREADRKFKYDKLHNKTFWKFIENLGKIISSFLEKAIKIFNNISIAIGKALPNLGSGIKNSVITFIKTLNIGKGALVKFILMLIFIGLLLGIGFGLFGGKGSSTLNASMNNKNLDIFINARPKDFLSNFSDSLMGMIPDKYRIQFTSFRNNLNKVVGNDNIANSIENKMRETTDKGRYNGISNIKKINDNENIHSIYKPNNKELEIDLDLYKDTNIDFYKLPEGVRNEIINQTSGKVPDQNKLKYTFTVGEKVMEDGRIRYRYIINQIEDPKIPLTTDMNLNNHFQILSKPITPISITSKDIDKYKDKYMFSYKDQKFVYPNVEDKIMNYNR